MATYNKGILGPFNGKLGTVIGVTWRGMDIMRSLPKKGNHLPSAVQLLQRERFSFVTDFLQPINPVLSRYYGANAGQKTRLNHALSYHMKEAVNYVDPNFVLLYNKVQISKGELPGLQNPTLSPLTGNEIKFSWEDNSNQGEANATDRLVVVIYEPVSSLFYFVLNAGTRGDINAGVILPNLFTGLTVHSWVTFASENEKQCATSIYMGTVVVS
jgi:hypothetical protein